LCAPEREEECSISSEIIGSEQYVAPYTRVSNKRKKSMIPKCKFFVEHPELYCAEMECGHRFDVRALLIHFMRNSMRCPLCRAGVDAMLSCKQSFPGESWMCEAEERIASEIQKEEETRQEEDMALASSLQSVYQFNLTAAVLNTLNDHAVTAAIFFYDRAPTEGFIEFPTHAMQFPMELLPLELHQRDLSRGISLYSSFSNESIGPQLDSSDNLSDLSTRFIDNANSVDLNNRTLFIGRGISLNDMTIRYSMSDTTLR
jgi:hypothetical protein